MAMKSGCDDYQCPCHDRLAHVARQLRMADQIPIRTQTENGWSFVPLTDLSAADAIKHIVRWLEPIAVPIPRTDDDKRIAIEKVMEAMPTWSDQQIAEYAAVPVQFVAACREMRRAEGRAVRG